MNGRFRELVRYGLVGGFNAATYFGGYTALVLVGVPYLLSALSAFLVSATIGYWLHEHWTFKGRSPSVRGLVTWFAAQGSATAVNFALLALLVDGFDVNSILAQAVLMPVTPIATYVVGRRYVFSRA
jgi:putative flippase GtrA